MAGRTTTTIRRRGRAAVRLAGLATVALVAAGCFWSLPGQGPDRQAYNPFETAITPETVGSLHELWRADTAGTAGAPVTSDAGVHLSDGTTTYSFDVDGEPLWSFELPPEYRPVGSMRTPLARGDRVLVSYGYGNLGGRFDGQWLDAATGTAEAPADAYDTLRGDTAVGVILAFGSGTPIGVGLSVYDVPTGARLWGGNTELFERGTGGVRVPTLGAETVYLPFGAAGVAAYPRTGGTTTCGPPTGGFACPRWTTTLPGGAATGPVVIGEGESTLYVSTNGGQVHALDAATGAVQWSATVAAGAARTPALAGGTLFVPTAEGTLAALPAAGCGAATCTPSWTGSTGAAIDVQPAVAGGLVFVGSSDGSLDAFPAAGCGAATCDPLWSGDAGARVTGAPAVSNGRLYVGTADGLVAFSPGH